MQAVRELSCACVVVLLLCCPQLKASGSNDSVVVASLSEEAWAMFALEPRKGLPIAYQELSVARASGDLRLIASGYNDIGSGYIFLGAYDTAMVYLDSCMAIRESLDDERGKAAVHNKRGIIFTRQGLLEEAIYETELSLLYFQRMQDSLNIGNTLNNLMVLHYDLHDYKTSILLGHEVLKYRHAAKDTLGFASTYINLGNAYVDNGDTLRGLRMMDSALAALAHQDSQSDVALIHHNKGMVYIDTKQYALAETHLLQALDISRSGGEKEAEAGALLGLGNLYRQMKDLPKSLTFLRRARQLCLETESKSDLRLAYMYLSSLFADLGKPDSAYHYLKEQQRLTEEIFNENSAEALHRAQAKYEVHQKENENALLKKDLDLSAAQLKTQTSQRIALGAALLVLALLSLVIFLRMRNRQKARVLALRQENIAALIQGEQQERSRLARDLHDGLGQLLSTARINVAALEGDLPVEEQVFANNALTMIDKAVTEVRNVSHNLIPDALGRQGLDAALEEMVADLNRANGPCLRLKLEHPPKTMNPDEHFALFRLLQELLTNAMRHADASEIWILGKPMDKGYLLEVGDNGKGFDPKTIAASPKGIGTQNIAARLAFLDASMEVDAHLGKGSRFIIHLPKS
jgi:two-component system NarL family sensor kinase